MSKTRIALRYRTLYYTQSYKKKIYRCNYYELFVINGCEFLEFFFFGFTDKTFYSFQIQISRSCIKVLCHFFLSIFVFVQKKKNAWFIERHFFFYTNIIFELYLCIFFPLYIIIIINDYSIFFLRLKSVVSPNSYFFQSYIKIVVQFFFFFNNFGRKLIDKAIYKKKKYQANI